MLFGNPLLDELHILFKVMKGLKRDLEALGDKSILEDEVARERLVKHLGVLFGHFKHYSQKELELFAKDDISQHCSKLIQEIQFISGDDYKGLFYGRMPGKRAREGAMKVRELKDKINEAKLNLLEAEADVKFESKQKKKAIKKKM